MSRKAFGLVWAAKASLAQNATQLQCVLVYKTTVFKKRFFETGHGPELSFVIGNFSGHMLMKLTQHWLNDAALFHLIGCVKSKSLNIRCTDNPVFSHDMQLHGVRVHV
jgi:hypothetical protein